MSVAVEAGIAPRSRARRRWILATAVAGGVVALGWAIHVGPFGGITVGRVAWAPLHAGPLTIAAPSGLKAYAIRGRSYEAGTRPPLIGYALTDFDPPAFESMQDVFASDWNGVGGAVPPSNHVGVEVEEVEYAMGPPLPVRLHLALSLDQPWIQDRSHGRVVSYRWGVFRHRGRLYAVRYWSGQNAPAKDRSAVLRALESIRFSR